MPQTILFLKFLGTFGSVVPSLSLGVGQVMSAWGFLIAGGIGLAVCLAFLIKYAIQHRNEMAIQYLCFTQI